MSQFQSDDFKQSRQVVVRAESRARSAGTGALLLSLLFFIPLAPFVGFFWALGARRKNDSGDSAVSPVAVCALVLGLLFTVAQGYLGYRGFDFYQQIKNGPDTALAAGFAGNASGFVSHFEASSPNDMRQASSFIEDLRTRFGDFHGARLRDRIAGESPVGPRIYELVFENAIVRAEASTSCDTDWLRSKLDYIVVQDPGNGNLVFPATGNQMMSQAPEDQ